MNAWRALLYWFTRGRGRCPQCGSVLDDLGVCASSHARTRSRLALALTQWLRGGRG